MTPEPVVRHHMRDTGGLDPGVHLAQHSGSSSSIPVIWWKSIRARLKTLAISGTGQAAQ